MNPYFFDFEIREKRREMLEEAQRISLLRLYNADRQRGIDRLLLALADLLIELGEKLRRRHTPSDALVSS